MSALHQIQMQFDAHQDRGLLRISTRDGREFRFWLTRRYVKALWPLVRGLLESDPQVSAQARPEDREAVLSFRHESAIQRSDFETHYEEQATETPLGEEPVLLARVRLEHPDSGGRIICLLPKEGQGLRLAMDDRLLHSFASLMVRTARLAEWELEMDLGPAGVAQQPTRTVN